MELFLRLVFGEQRLYLSFKVRHQSGRPYMLKNPKSLWEAEKRGGHYVLGRGDYIDFSKETFSPSSRLFVEQLKAMLRESGYTDMKYFNEGAMWPLKGYELDRFYDTFLGERLDIEWSKAKMTDHLLLSHAPLSLKMYGKKMEDSFKNFVGVKVSGKILPLLHGEEFTYSIGKGYFSRLTQEEEALLTPFGQIAEDGAFSFTVGLSHLSEFYRRTLPEILSVPGLSYMEDCPEEVETFLPPEAVFVFQLSLEESLLICECLVRYGEVGLPLLGRRKKGEEEDGVKRDEQMEMAAKRTLLKLFPNFDEQKNRFQREVEDEDLVQFLREGLPLLERLGEVYSTQSLQKIKFQPFPKFQMSLSLESNLLDVEVETTDLSPEEPLLRWYKRRSPCRSTVLFT